VRRRRNVSTASTASRGAQSHAGGMRRGVVEALAMMRADAADGHAMLPKLAGWACGAHGSLEQWRSGRGSKRSRRPSSQTASLFAESSSTQKRPSPSQGFCSITSHRRGEANRVPAERITKPSLMTNRAKHNWNQASRSRAFDRSGCSHQMQSSRSFWEPRSVALSISQWHS